MLCKVYSFFNFPVKVQTTTACALFCLFCPRGQCVCPACVIHSHFSSFSWHPSEGHMKGRGNQRKEDKAGQEGQRSGALTAVHILGSWRREEKPARHPRSNSRQDHPLGKHYRAPTVYDTTDAYEAPPVSLVLGFSSKKDGYDPSYGSSWGGHWSDLLWENKMGCLV